MVDFWSELSELDELRGGRLCRAGGGAPRAAAQGKDASAPTLSIERLHQLRALGGPGDGSFFTELCATFQREARKRVEGTARALEAGDATAAGRNIHSLKSMAAELGAAQLAGLCDSLETAAPEGDLSASPPDIVRLRDELDRVERALQEATGDRSTEHAGPGSP